ncbi:MAG: hypothetical protein BWY57_01234 [Betaproteobacteria bacterium ADurb.Bin341]|nr:MAG: hypothetical protein BWY57_01234 [Betaproteobacteria bacterium ADurb.Bin341]
MRKVSSVILKVIAGFFFYMVSLLAFVSEPPAVVKLGILIGFSVPAVVALGGGLALTRFRNWRRDTGVVLLCASGFTAFVVFTFACLLMTDEFPKMTGPNTLAFFGDYLTGGGFIVGLAVLGWVLVEANMGMAEQSTALDEDSAE